MTNEMVRRSPFRNEMKLSEEKQSGYSAILRFTEVPKLAEKKQNHV